ncbi:MAG: sensor histidine kinase [Tessaracoccus sp.]|uniref:sensor histidine kinase n=1 Tax=Tessaracoccus sp. TaxID=1971211 RepID=UPI001EC099E6|nr:sensor histidine kinase [Tessaracoccus sp.]MBK7820027.1 sensor histidine kinase [Tessaracoccus sp.]
MRRREATWASPWLADSLVAVALAAVALGLAVSAPHGPAGRPADGATYALIALGALPYAVRSRWPLAALVVAAAPLAVLIVRGDSSSALGAGAFLLAYSVASLAPRRHLWAAVGVVAILLMVLRGLVPAYMTVPQLINNAFLFTGAFVLGDWARRRREQLSWAEQRSAMIEREQAQLAAQAVMEERLRIARDLHDITAHSLGVIAVQAGVAAHVMRSAPDEAEATMRSIAGTSREALGEIRGLVSALRTSSDDDYAPTPRLADLERLADEASAAGQDVDWRLGPVPEDAIPATTQAAAYRIVQQALSNAREHASSRPVVVELATKDGELILTVANPLGAAPPRGEKGHGILGMRERAELAGGRLEAGAADATYRVAARFPMRRPS